MRNYKRKRPRGWNKDRRMILAVRLRGEGMSLRQAARELGVSEGTIRNDLKRWQQANSNVVPLVRKSDAQSCPRGGEITHPDYAPRTTAEALGLPPGSKTVRQEWAERAAELLTDWR